MSSPTQAVLRHFRREGWICCIVEKYIAAIRQRKDAFEFGDILAYNPEFTSGGIALIQATSISHMAEREGKILKSPHFQGWRLTGGRVFLAGAGTRKKPGKRRSWEVKVKELS